MKKIFILVFIIIFVSGFNIERLQSQETQPKQPSLNSRINELNKEVDFLKTEIEQSKKLQIIKDDYHSILEKTNNQLSLWYRPYNLIISILTFLFTIGVFIAGYYIVHQINELKKQEKKSKDAITKHGDTELERLIHELATQQIKDKEREQSVEQNADKKINLAKDIALAKYAQSTTTSPISSGQSAFGSYLFDQKQIDDLVRLLSGKDSGKDEPKSFSELAKDDKLNKLK